MLRTAIKYFLISSYKLYKYRDYMEKIIWNDFAKQRVKEELPIQVNLTIYNKVIDLLSIQEGEWFLLSGAEAYKASGIEIATFRRRVNELVKMGVLLKREVIVNDYKRWAYYRLS